MYCSAVEFRTLDGSGRELYHGCPWQTKLVGLYWISVVYIDTAVRNGSTVGLKTWVRLDAMPSCPGSMRRPGGDTDASTRTGGSKRRYLAARPPQPVGSRATGRQGRLVRASETSGRGRHRPEPADTNGVVPRSQWWTRVGLKTGAESRPV